MPGEDKARRLSANGAVALLFEPVGDAFGAEDVRTVGQLSVDAVEGGKADAALEGGGAGQLELGFALQRSSLEDVVGHSLGELLQVEQVPVGEVEAVLAEQQLVTGHLLGALVQQVGHADEGGQDLLAGQVVVAKGTADDARVGVLKVAAVSGTAKRVENVPTCVFVQRR